MLITSIGSVCFNRWNVCRPTGLTYISSPFDNILNNGIRQFDNILALLKEDYRQLEEAESLEYQETQGTRIDGQNAEYHGYKYIGQKLGKEFILAHFFDGQKVNTYLPEDEAWRRWHHKCEAFGRALDGGEKLALVSIRLEDDKERERNQLWGGLLKLADYIKERYRRDEGNTRIISLIATDVEEVLIEFKEPMAEQILIPSGAELGKRYYRRQYRDIYKDTILNELALSERSKEK